jgi:hypothetical protein
VDEILMYVGCWFCSKAWWLWYLMHGLHRVRFPNGGISSHNLTW